MAKKEKEVVPEFNMSAAIREVLTEDPKASAKEATEAIQAKYPKTTLNKNSFSVAYYTIKKKLMGGKTSRRSAGTLNRRRVTGTSAVSIEALKLAANLVKELGSVDAAIETLNALKMVQVG